MAGPARDVVTDPRFMRKLFARLRPAELLDVLRVWGETDVRCRQLWSDLTGDDDAIIPTKSAIVEELVQLFNEGLPFSLVGDLDLKYQHLHSSARTWNVLKLSSDSNSADESLPTVDDVGQTIGRELGVYFKQSTVACTFGSETWIRIAVQERQGVLRPTDTIVLVHRPHSPWLLCNSVALKKEFQEYVFHALASTFKVLRVRKWNLSGKHIDGLFDMLLKKDSQGQYSKFRTAELTTEINPLAPVTRKRKHRDENDRTDDVGANGNILQAVAEDRALHNDRTAATKEAFGTCAQPVLERVDFKVTSNFKGSKVFGYDGPLTSRVRFEGSSVIKGIQALVPLGMADAPLPEHLVQLHSLSQNEISISL